MIIMSRKSRALHTVLEKGGVSAFVAKNTYFAYRKIIIPKIYNNLKKQQQRGGGRRGKASSETYCRAPGISLDSYHFDIYVVLKAIFSCVVCVRAVDNKKQSGEGGRRRI